MATLGERFEHYTLVLLTSTGEPRRLVWDKALDSLVRKSEY